MNAPHPRSMRQALWPHLRPHRWTLLAATLLNAFHGIAIAFQTVIPKYVIDDVLLNERLVGASRWTWLAGLVGLYLFASIVWRMLVWHVSYRMFTRVREKLIFGLRRQFFAHVNHLCLRFHRQKHSGELFAYLFGSPLATINQYYNHFATSVPGAVFNLVWTLVWVSLWDPVMSVMLAVSVLTTVVLMQRAHRRVRALHEDFQRTESDVSAYVADLLRGTRDVKLHAFEHSSVERFSDRVEMIGRKSYERDIKTHVLNMWYEGAGYACFAALCGLGAWRYSTGSISVGEFQAYLTAFIALQFPLNTLFSLGLAHAAARAGLNRIDAVLQTASSTPDPEPKPVLSEAKGRISASSIPPRADLTLHDVTFAYDHASGAAPVLHHLDLHIPYGQHVALVGPSGSGKSTLAQLLLRMYDPDHGRITLSDVDLRSLPGAELRARFGVVPQDPFLFRTSIRENLKVAAPDATDDQLRAACIAANAWDFIQALPDGLDTSLAEGGCSLSGGQRQRLAIARALLKNPDYFIFDEATSALDAQSEGLIQSAIENAWRDRTAILIAHRLATIRNCDRILVLQHGRIVEDGTYDQLLARRGLFAELVHAQSLTTQAA